MTIGAWLVNPFMDIMLCNPLCCHVQLIRTHLIVHAKQGLHSSSWIPLPGRYWCWSAWQLIFCLFSTQRLALVPSALSYMTIPRICADKSILCWNTIEIQLSGKEEDYHIHQLMDVVVFLLATKLDSSREAWVE